MLVKRYRNLALSVVFSGLFALPAGAQQFSFDAVTCLNHNTGQAVAGSLQGDSPDCSALQTERGDRVSFVLNGVANGTIRVECDEVSEQEPNDFPDVNEVDLSAGGCVIISGDIHTGFGNPAQPNPNLDFDDYLVFVAPQVAYGIELSGSAIAGIFDARSGEFLTECQGGCTLQAPSDMLIVEVVAPQATAYTLQLGSDDGAQVRGLQAGPMTKQAPSGYKFNEERRQY